MRSISLLKQQGQGLIEILIVAVIIIISCVSLILFQSAVSYRDSLALQQSDATVLAMNEIEALRDYNVLTAQTPYTPYSGIVSGSSTTTNYNATYTITWTVTTVAVPAYKTIDVSVTWNDLRNNPQTIRLTTNVAGLQPVFSATVLY